MNKIFYDYLCCPTCKGDLKKTVAAFKCVACQVNYKIQDGIPTLIDLTTIPEHFHSQIEYFEKERVTKDTTYTLLDWQQSYVDRFLTFYPKVSKKVVIDCGTGSGYMAIELAKKGAYVIATELTIRSLIRLKSIVEEFHLEENVMLVCCSAEELPFKTRSADFFISNAVMEHLPREKEAIAEIDRVTKKKAGLLVVVPLMYSYLFPLLVPINKFHDKRIGHLRRYDKKSLTQKFKNWKSLKTYYTGHLKKVFKVGINLIFPLFDSKRIEKDDALMTDQSKWASNISMIFSKR